MDDLGFGHRKKGKQDMQKIEVTGSKSLSEIVKEFVPAGGQFKIEIEGNASTIAASMAKPTCRIAASDFFLAIAGSGAVGEALLQRAIRAAQERASGLALTAQDAEAMEKLETKAKTLCDEWAQSLPPVPKAASVRVKGMATDVSGIAEHGMLDVLGVGTKATPVLVPVA
jgi:hypothetical protein